MSGDKRSVVTDALAVLGTIITGKGVGRDAIHLAVEPAIAGMKLHPGDDVGVADGLAWRDGFAKVKTVGIVDPFLKRAVQEGEEFLLVVYPRQITSLRHVWSHPDFPEGAPEKIVVEKIVEVHVAAKETDVDRAKKRLQELADELTGECLDLRVYMEGLNNGYWCDGGRWEGGGYGKQAPPQEAFDLYAIVQGRRAYGESKIDDSDSWHFSCSC